MTDIPGILQPAGTYFDMDDSSYIEGVVPPVETSYYNTLALWTIPAFDNFDLDDRTVFFSFVIRFRIVSGGVSFTAFNDSPNPGPNSASDQTNSEWVEQVFAVTAAYEFGGGVPGGGDQQTAIVEAVRNGTWGYTPFEGEFGPLVWSGSSFTPGGGTVQISYLGLRVDGDTVGPWEPPTVDPEPPYITPALTGSLGLVGQFYV